MSSRICHSIKKSYKLVWKKQTSLTWLVSKRFCQMILSHFPKKSVWENVFTYTYELSNRTVKLMSVNETSEEFFVENCILIHSWFSSNNSTEASKGNWLMKQLTSAKNSLNNVVTMFVNSLYLEFIVISTKSNSDLATEIFIFNISND